LLRELQSFYLFPLLKSFEIIIQLGAILAVVVLYYKSFLVGPKVWKPVLAAFIPTGVIGFLLYKFIKGYLLGNDFITVVALLLGGLVMIGLEMVYREKEHHLDKVEEIPLQSAVLVGLIQALSIIPGVSRSAVSILGGMFLGLKRKTAVEFSFLLAVPTMLAATGLDLIKSSFKFTNQEYLLLLLGFLCSFLVALVVVKWLVKYVEKNTFIPFGVYRIAVAIIFWLIILQ
jgi:undecaprenyl-diphosphatase